ncbi:sugar transferase [Rhodanobacter thiooxydans]|uniref:Sugar transferase n=1 Tax=Rhodanobacter thiooxydans TaxID=416169 RepID=A0A154QD06_9GAMM|nr:TIGR03087 family PEP-CTERM/XrtA system glycosyltransferase [Rhodanobacter thiooxydans]EIM02177.1 group 1 glycosyl transferase [Rhodanobacter thiooxydans LCS2]KZC22022.1 sugar transferase [Rhodanobacter thiooxydans]MCW0200489.1 TIGR03087 family PEP-CTERM/XrtA system glycosyltransferase [Rhodanobacter thiooxydans]
MQSVLFLCHRLPWPPSKGDKIRSYHVLRRLAGRYRVYLGTFVDDPADWQHLAAVEALCADVCVRPLPSWRAGWRALAALTRGEPLTVGIYRDRVMRRWVERLLAEHKLELALCYSSGVAPFVMQHTQLRRVMDFVDVDSDKWNQYAQQAGAVKRLVYRREARRLAEFECTIAAQFDASVFVSEAEAAFFRQLVPESAGRVHGIPNGVDAGYWDPRRVCSSPYRPGERVVVFVGAMDYRANVDAVWWFAQEVWPRIAARRQDARFYIVGSQPTAAVRVLGQLAGITVTGRVEDVRPYLAHAHVVTAPLRVARGIQNKVLEALAMEKVLLATPAAYAGVADFAGRQGCIDESPEVMATEALRWLDAPQAVRVSAARAEVLSRYDWGRSLDTYENVLRNVRHGAASMDVIGTAGLGVCP